MEDANTSCVGYDHGVNTQLELNMHGVLNAARRLKVFSG